MIQTYENYQYYLSNKNSINKPLFGLHIDNKLYSIAHCHKGTLWNFADALREYGFIDAIYITGGTDYCFYRDKDAARHDIGDPADYPHEKWKGIIPWLVFRITE